MSDPEFPPPAPSAARPPAPPAVPPGQPPERYEATVHTTDLAVSGVDAVAQLSDLDLDRLPDPAGEMRVLVDPNDISRLVDQGFEVRLLRAVPVQPLDPALIASDEDVESWYTERLSPAEES